MGILLDKHMSMDLEWLSSGLRMSLLDQVKSINASWMLIDNVFRSLPMGLPIPGSDYARGSDRVFCSILLCWRLYIKGYKWLFLLFLSTILVHVQTSYTWIQDAIESACIRVSAEMFGTNGSAIWYYMCIIVSIFIIRIYPVVAEIKPWKW